MKTYNYDKIKIPFIQTYIPAGFPFPAQDYIEDDINLQELLIQHPLSTFLIRVQGNSMINACIPEDALLLVDKSVKAKNKDIIVEVIEGKFTVKRLLKTGKTIFLYPENPSYIPRLFARTFIRGISFDSEYCNSGF